MKPFRKWMCLGLALVVGTSVGSPTSPSPTPLQARPDESFLVAVPVGGKHEFLLPVTKWGRYSIQANGEQPVTLSLADRRNGVFETAGGGENTRPRIDLFLDIGEYRLTVQGTRKAAGTTTVTATPFRSPADFKPSHLLALRENRVSLDDHQQTTFWFEARTDTVVYIEAVGRNLAALSLWRDGEWLVKTNNRTFVSYPTLETPLSGIAFRARLPKGIYMVGAYGGRGRDWALKSDEHPFALQFDMDSVANNSTTFWTIPPRGYARFSISAGITTAVVEANDKKRLLVDVKRLNSEFPNSRASASDSIFEKSNGPRIALELGRSGSGGDRRVVTVSGTPGQKFSFQGLSQSQSSLSGNPGGNFWISSKHTGNHLDQIGASGLVVDQANGEIRALQADTLASNREIAKRFNLLEPVNTFVWVNEDGKFSVTPGGVAMSWRLRRYFTLQLPPNDLPPEFSTVSRVIELTRGLYLLEIIPVQKGIASIVLKESSLMGAVLQAGKSATGTESSTKWTAPRPALQFANFPVGGNQLLGIVVNSQSPERSITTVRALPVNPDDPLGFWSKPNEKLEIPLRLDGRRSVAVTDRQGAPVAFEFDGKRVDGAIEAEAGPHNLSLPGEGGEPRSLVLKSTKPELLPTSPLQAFPDETRIAIPRFPQIPAGTDKFFDLDQGQQLPFALHVSEPGLYRIETTGRLATKLDLNDRFQQFSRSAETNGTGRNAMLIEYLLAGEYQVNVGTVGQSAGHLGLSVFRNTLVDGGSLEANIDSRKFIEAFSGAEYSLQIPKPGHFRIESIGQNGNFPLRLEDKGGWPMPALSESALEQDLPAGSYRLVSLPIPQAGRQITRLLPVQDKRTIKGKGPHALELNSGLSSTWIEGKRKKAAGSPALFDLELTAPIEATLYVTKGFEAKVFASGRDSALLSWSGTKTFPLPMGRYRIAVQPEKKRNHAPYRIAVSTQQLIPGLSYPLHQAQTLELSLGRTSIVEIGSQGKLDVSGTLLEADGKTVVARSDDGFLDWNFAISRSLKAGKYFLRVESEKPSFSKTTVFLRALADTLMDSLVAPGGKSRSVPCNLNRRLGIFPLNTSGGGDLIACAVQAKSRVGCALEKKDFGSDEWLALGQTVGTNPSLTLPVSKQGNYRLKVWSESNLDEKFNIVYCSPTAQTTTLKDAQSGLSGSPEPMGADSRAWYKIDLGSHAPGLFKATAEPNTPTSIGAGTVVDSALADEGAAWFSAAQANAWIELRFEPASRYQVKLSPWVLDKSQSIALPLVAAVPRILETAFPSTSMALLSAETDGGKPVIGSVAARTERTNRFTIAGQGIRSTFWTGPNGSIAVAMPGDDRRLALWNASPAVEGTTYMAKLGLAELPVIEGGSLAVGTSSWNLDKICARKLPLSRGAAQLRILIPSNGAVLVQGEDGSTALEGSQDPMVKDFTVNGGSVYLLALRDGAQFEVTQFALSTPNPATASSFPPGNSGWQQKMSREGKLLLALPPSIDRPRSLQFGGSLQRANWFDGKGMLHSDLENGAPVGPGGLLELFYAPGWAKANLCDANTPSEVMTCKWGESIAATGTREISQTSVVALADRTSWFSFSVPDTQQLHLSIAVPASAILLREGVVVNQREAWDAFDWDLPLAPGRYKLGVHSLAGSSLSGLTLAALFRPLPVFTEKQPYNGFLAPGESRLVAFDVAKQDQFGIGLRMGKETVQASLFDSQGALWEAGKQQFVSLPPGRYYLWLRVPQGSEGTDLTIRLFGQEPPPNQPPQALVKWIVEGGSGPRPVFSNRDEPNADGGTPGWQRLIRPGEAQDDAEEPSDPDQEQVQEPDESQVQEQDSESSEPQESTQEEGTEGE